MTIIPQFNAIFRSTALAVCLMITLAACSSDFSAVTNPVSTAGVDQALADIEAIQALTPNPGQDLPAPDVELAKLGQELFFDPILSGDQNIACATCHHPDLAMADGRALPIGTGGTGFGSERIFNDTVVVNGRVIDNPLAGDFVPRNSPTVINATLLDVQFWDGRVQSYGLEELVTTPDDTVNELGLTDSLHAQALFPVTSKHEMAGNTWGGLEPAEVRLNLAARLSEHDAYRARFAEVFGSETVEPVQIAEALAAFQQELVFTNSPWDQYLAGDVNALTEAEKRGALIFFGGARPEVNCSSCHSGDLFTDQSFHNLLVPQLGPGKGHGDSGLEDWGRGMVTEDEADQFAFRTPSLRNVALTGPYFHDGAYDSLEDVIRHHAQIWDGAENYDPNQHLSEALASSVQPYSVEAQGHSAATELADGLPLTDADIADLISFLNSLTDPQLHNLEYLLPDAVPSGLPLDPLAENPVRASNSLEQAAGQ